MINPSFEHALEEGESRYTLVMVASKRAKQIVEGSKPLIETESKKPVTIAIEEIVEGKIGYERKPE